MPQEKARVTATEAKNSFGPLLEKAIRGGVVVITKHDAPKAVLISVEEYAALSGVPEAKINSLTAEFDSLLLSQQRPGARRAIQTSFHASPQQLGRAAVADARKRG